MPLKSLKIIMLASPRRNEKVNILLIGMPIVQPLWRAIWQHKVKLKMYVP